MSAGADTRRNEGGAFLVPTGEIKVPVLINTRIITVVFLLLCTIGLFNLYSATVGGPQFYSQLRNAGLGLIVFGVFGWLISPRVINQYTYWLFGFVCILLAVVLVVGDIRGGSQRWIEIGGFSGQPSELAKLVSAIVTARFFYTNRSVHPYRIRDLWPLAAMIGLIFGLIFPQPDLGTAGVCVIVAVAQLAFVRIDFRSLLLAGGLGTAAASVAWGFVLHDYQRLRILNLFNPELDPSGSGYHALQSLVAIGSGNLFGKGFLQGTQTQLQFLPERHTDFIFSVFAEEHGFAGAALVFALFLGLTYVGLTVARQAKDTFSALLAAGLSAFFFVEFLINMAMILGLFPVVGIPLPLFSFGGSALLSVACGLGMLVAIDRENFGRFRKSRGFHRKGREVGSVASQ